MGTPNPRTNWEDRVAAARRLVPPADIDVRFAVRRAIETEMALDDKATGARTLWGEMSDLSGAFWLRGLLGGGMLAAIPLCTVAVQAAHELLETARLASPTLLGF